MAGEIFRISPNKEASGFHLQPQTQTTMNSTESYTEPLTQADDEPSVLAYAGAAALIVGCAASIAIGFTFIAALAITDKLNPFKRRKK